MDFRIIEGLNEKEILELYDNNVLKIASTYCVYCPGTNYYAGCRYYPGAYNPTGENPCHADHWAENGYSCCSITWGCGINVFGCAYVNQIPR